MLSRWISITTVALIGAVTLAACGGGDSTTPNVVGKRLDVAESSVKDAGLDYEEVGGGAFGIVVKSNWTVCEQDPKAGEKTSGKVKLIVDRTCPATAGSTTTTTATTTAAATPPVSGDSADLIRGRLEGAGYTVQDQEPGGDPAPTAALQVTMKKGDTTIYLYSSPADAKAGAKEFASLEKTNPDQISVEVVDDQVYVATVEEPARVSSAEFGKIMRTAQGN